MLLRASGHVPPTFFGRGTSVEVARVRRTAGALGRPADGALAVEAARPGEKLTSWYNSGASVTPDSRDSGATAEEMFLAAQRARLSEAAASLSQMAARHAKGNPDLEHIVRNGRILPASGNPATSCSCLPCRNHPRSATLPPRSPLPRAWKR